MSLKIFCEYEDHANIVNFYIYDKKENGDKDLCVNLNHDGLLFEKVLKDMPPPRPSFSIHKMEYGQQFMQAMADALEKQGVRPTGKPTLENELTATKKHLEDMRALVLGVQNLSHTRSFNPSTSVPFQEAWVDPFDEETAGEK